MEMLKIINFGEVDEAAAASYRLREASRAVVFDGDNNVAVFHATKNNYYKLPGGGIEQGEDRQEALKRECQEEIGCDIEVIGELGCIIEYRAEQNLRQVSYCYVARVVGEKGLPHLEAGEIAEGFQTEWLPYGEAKKLLEGSSPTVYEGKFMVARDLAFLEAAASQLPLV